MNECKKKLATSFNKVERLTEVFNSTNVEKILYETAKIEPTVKETRDITNKLNADYVEHIAKLQELRERGI